MEDEADSRVDGEEHVRAEYQRNSVQEAECGWGGGVGPEEGEDNRVPQAGACRPWTLDLLHSTSYLESAAVKVEAHLQPHSRQVATRAMEEASTWVFQEAETFAAASSTQLDGALGSRRPCDRKHRFRRLSGGCEDDRDGGPDGNVCFCVAQDAALEMLRCPSQKDSLWKLRVLLCGRK